MLAAMSMNESDVKGRQSSISPKKIMCAVPRPQL